MGHGVVGPPKKNYSRPNVDGICGHFPAIFTSFGVFTWGSATHTPQPAPTTPTCHMVWDPMAQGRSPMTDALLVGCQLGSLGRQLVSVGGRLSVGGQILIPLAEGDPSQVTMFPPRDRTQNLVTGANHFFLLLLLSSPYPQPLSISAACGVPLGHAPLWC